jgi:hypothetical protein
MADDVDPIQLDTCRGLFASLGVEDIAVKYGHNADDVRGVVNNLRKAGALRTIVKQAADIQEWARK